MAFTLGQNPDVSKIKEAGEQKLIFCMSSTGKTFKETDTIGFLTEMSGMGAEKEEKTYSGYHFKNDVKKNGKTTLNDVSCTENLTADELEKIRGYFKNDTVVYVAVFDTDESNTVLYSCKGVIGSWGTELPNGDTCTLTYTLRLEEDYLDGVTYTA